MRFATAIVASLCLAAPAAAANPAATKLQSKLERRIDAYVVHALAEEQLSGRLLLQRGGIRIERSWGHANHEAQRGFEPDDPFLVASVNKALTVALAGRLLDEGRLRLADPVGRWIPRWPFDDGMTVEHLVGHRAGIPHRLAAENDRTERVDAAAMVERARQRSLLFEPGADTSYSNGGYSVLARVLEIAGEASYETLMQRHVFAAAGMEHSRAIGLPDDSPVRSYLPGPEGPLPTAAEWNASHLVGAASLATTAEDLLRFRRAVSSGALGPSAQQLLHRPRIDWSGIVHGWRAWVHHDAENDLDIVFTGNLHSGAVDRLAQDLPRLAAGAKVRPLPKLKLRPVSVSEAELERYTGRFRIPSGLTIPFYVDDGILWADGWILISLGQGRFFSSQDYVTLQAVEQGDRGVLRWDWIENGRTTACPRVD